MSNNSMYFYRTPLNDVILGDKIILKIVMESEEPFKVAVVCSSNQNRSMEAHNFLAKKGFKVHSYGSGTYVKLPGPSPSQPNIYDFNTSYDEMYKDLTSKDKNLYTQNGILHMLDRNRRIKTCPERFQSMRENFNVIITCEERVYDQVIEDLENREKTDPLPAHVVNIDIQDNHEEATIGAFIICDLCSLMAESDDLDSDIEEMLQELEAKSNRTFLHTVVFY